MGYKNMKKSLLALAIAALAASSAASAVTVYDKDGTSLDVYGRVQGVVYSKNAGGAGANADDNTIVASGRLGFDMRTQLTPGIAGFAKVEWEMADGQKYDNGFQARYAWVGADFGQYGQIKAGTFEDAVKYVLNTTDIFDDWGCTGQAGNDDKRDAMVMYSWSGYGFDANVSYQASQKGQLVDGAYFRGFDANGDRNGETLDIENAFAVSLGYTSPDVLFGPIAVRAAYGYAKFTDHGYENPNNGNFILPDLPLTNPATDTVAGVYDNYKQYAVSLSWGTLAQGPYVAALYQNRDFSLRNITVGTLNDADTSYSVEGVEFVVGYGFANGVSIRTGYEWQQVDFDTDDSDVTAQTVPVYVNYQINPNFNVWAEARFDAGTDDDTLRTDANGDLVGKNFKDVTGANFAEHVYSVGARFTF